MESERPVERVSRRRFLARMTAGIAAGPLIGSAVAGCAQSIGGGRSAPLAQGRSGLNILFVFTDQERYFGQWPAGFTLPGHERLQGAGVRFHNHYCPATMCTSSRSVLMTGLQTADNRMFENVDLPWIKALSTETIRLPIPTVGHMLPKLRSRCHLPTRRWRCTASRTTTRPATSWDTSSAAITSII